MQQKFAEKRKREITVQKLRVEFLGPVMNSGFERIGQEDCISNADCSRSPPKQKPIGFSTFFKFVVYYIKLLTRWIFFF